MAAKDVPAADQPSIVLAAQKDAYYRREMRESFVQAADAVLGPHASVAALPEVKVLAELAYFGLTTLRGRQTPGEEYCDVFLVNKSKGNNGTRLPTLSSRVVLLLAAVVLPYLGKRVENGGWNSLMSLFQKPLSARERAEALRKRMLLRQQRAAAAAEEGGRGISIDLEDGNATETSYLSLVWAKRALLVSWIFGWSTYFYRLHLAIFYLRGEFMDWSKRVSGLQYSLTRAPPAERASYRILGWFLLTQLAVESVAPVKETVLSIGKAWGVVYKGPRNPLAQGSRGDVEEGELGLAGETAVVPSLASDDPEDDRDFIRGEDRHAKGLENVSCGICLSPVENGAAPPCGHLFCYQHIVEAISVRKECPLCRHECDPSQVMCVYYTL